MIKEVHFSYLNPENLISLAEQSIGVIQKNHEAETVFDKSIQKAEAAITLARQAVGTSTKENLTDQVFTADMNRDTSYNAIRLHVEAGTKRHRNIQYQEASTRLQQLLNKHGRGINKLPYAEQSTAVKALLQELDTQTAQTDILITGLRGFVTDLDQDQQDFDIVFAKRNTEKAESTAITDKEAIRVLKPEMVNFYTLVNAFYINEQVPGIDTTIEELNVIIDRIVNSAKR
ncbi:DUF6261 family protein [Aquimarina algicola]|uniref:Uncharacterized protein n=1 Tax=Aquimarina algicola TaxID=2589995 RepID=A0A504JF45_9FLAO|nr:DUF6261 family protein [Aquimarina algicola]TPN89304.1 hypothetical protein FHK87_03495 [Aquimarina algicola]